LGVADRVTFLGQVAPGQALGLMRRARAGVIPLPAEGSAEARWFTAPLKLFELWATGAPVVVTDLPSLRALVRDGDTGLIAPAHPEGLAAALDRLLGDPTLAARLAGAGRAEAATRSWDARARTLLEFLDRHCR
jgi:glycosyltransferase involved in cell wall biosynthesis